MAFCGLSRQELKENGWYDKETQKCTAVCGGGVVCTKFYAQHFVTPTAATAAEYYLAEMTVFSSKKKSGIRHGVYKIAANHMAYYYHDKQQSIYYNDSNLQIRLLFTAVADAHRFVNEMLQMLGFSHIVATHSENYPTLTPDFEPTLVFATHYDATEYPDSATASTVNTELPRAMNSTLSDVQHLMMLERRDHDDFRGLNVFNCHLIGQAVDKTYADDENNVFFMSWAMHQRFDGLNSVPKNVPSIAIRLESVGNVMETVVPGITRQRANLTIECVNLDTFEVTRARLKHPFTPNVEKLEIETCVYPADMETFIDCVTYKYEETKFIWEQKVTPGQLVDETTATELRTSGTRRARVSLNQRRAAKSKKGQEVRQRHVCVGNTIFCTY